MGRLPQSHIDSRFRARREIEFGENLGPETQHLHSEARCANDAPNNATRTASGMEYRYRWMEEMLGPRC